MDTDYIDNIIQSNLYLKRNETLTDSLYSCFRQTVVLGKLAAGTCICEERLSKSLHISRTPIRVALDRLANEHLVKRVPGEGVVVLGISLRDAEEIYEIRKALEPLGFIKAAHNMEEVDFENMRLLLERGEKENAEGDVDAVVANFSEFNQFVLGHASMARLHDIIDSISVYLSYFRDNAIRKSARREIALKEHWNIYLAMRFSSDEKIRTEIETHLLNNYRFVAKVMGGLGIA
ncbi:GntR family transcriptional regulator [Alkalibaculum bacchi]|jgi:DNA-binding GntR family transcriptional regulator|uniref:GntR family transcriptional regulator n=1 Tax=Alkalibaculum bacchi TaxID=645887 RepID=UPI0026F281E9|nr:GntR family transcriptional regulator [Alkalibaculum bacchi]